MRIGVDATCWQNMRGYGRHARSLLTALVRLDPANCYTFFTDSTPDLQAMPPQAEIRLVNTSVATALAASAHGHRSIRDLWQMSRALSDPSFDVLLFPTVYSYVPVFSRAKKVVIIHDIIAEHYPELTLPKTGARLSWKLKAALGRWQANAIVTVSDYSREGILRHFRARPDRVFVVGEASDPVFQILEDPQITPRLRSLGLENTGRVIVYVGGFSPHKNLEALVAAFANICGRAEYQDTRLFMVGEYKNEIFHSYFSTIKGQVEALGLASRVVFTGYLPDDELAVLLNLSTALVLPSFMEGFGLPAIEAAACGCPVIATKASPLPAILGEGGLFINPDRQDELHSMLIQVLGSDALRMRMREAGILAAGRFTWDAAAREMMTVLHKIARQ